MPLQGDIAVVEEEQVPDQPLGGDVSVTTSGEDRKLFNVSSTKYKCLKIW